MTMRRTRSAEREWFLGLRERATVRRGVLEYLLAIMRPKEP